jgi:hypothetical protein
MTLRGIVFLVLTGGILLIGFAFAANLRFIQTGQSGWDDKGNYILAVEDVPNKRLRRFLEAYVGTSSALSNGILRDFADDLEPVLPAAPEGWTRSDWTIAAGEALTGETYKKTMLFVSTTNSILKDFEKTADDGFGAVAVYDTGNGLVALRIQGDRGALREAENGKVQSKRPTTDIVLSIDGVPVVRKPKFSNAAKTGKDQPMRFDWFRMHFGGVFGVEVISTAAEADALALMDLLDVAGLEASIPRPIASQ